MKFSDLPTDVQKALKEGHCRCRRVWMSVIPHKPCSYCRALRLYRDLIRAEKSA